MHGMQFWYLIGPSAADGMTSILRGLPNTRSRQTVLPLCSSTRDYEMPDRILGAAPALQAIHRRRCLQRSFAARALRPTPDPAAI